MPDTGLTAPPDSGNSAGALPGNRRLDLYLQYDRPLEKQELARFKTLIQRRRNREPVAYITGEKGFFESSFQVGPGVLIPRPDTETLVTAASMILADMVSPPGAILELGVGSGAIVVSLAKAHPGHRFLPAIFPGPLWIRPGKMPSGKKKSAPSIFSTGHGWIL